MYLNSWQIQLHQLQTASKAEKNGFDITKLIFQNVSTVCLRGAVVKELLARADLPGSTPGGIVFCFFVPCFFFFSLCFLTLFFFRPVFRYSYFWPSWWSCTWINMYFKPKSGVLLWKRDFKNSLIDNHTGPAFDQKKTISCQDMSLLWNSWFFFQC